MSTAIKTLKLPFLRLNRAKADEFARLQTLNTAVGNAILALPKAERRALTSKAFADVEIGSAWINQTIRHANARTKVRQFRCLPLETNNQNWTLQKVGHTYSVSFGLRRGLKKRVPLGVHHASHQRWLDAILEGRATSGSLKLWRSRKGVWYACLSVSMDVPDAEPTGRWIGLDRGQNVPLSAATPDGPVIFWQARRIRHIRRVYAGRRKQLQAAGKHRAVKKLERRERRMITHINHGLSKDVVALAQRCHAGIRLEDLSGIRQRRPQRQSTKTDAGQNRDYWPFFQLEQFITYKAQLAGVAVEKVPAAYTSKSCHHCGALGTRKRHRFVCLRCTYHAHADANAAMNVRDWHGLCCPLVLEAPVDGAHGMPRDTVRKAAGSEERVVGQEREPPCMGAGILSLQAEEDVKQSIGKVSVYKSMSEQRYIMHPSDTAEIGTTGLRVTRLGLGGVALSGVPPATNPQAITAEAEALRLVHRSLELGVRYFDTAPMYGLGQSERRFGQGLSGIDRESYVLSTKVGRVLDPIEPGSTQMQWSFDFSRHGAQRSFRESLERLGLERVDILFIHDPDNHYLQALTQTFPVLMELRAQGLVKAIGAGMNQWEMELRFAKEGDFNCFLLAGRYTLLEQTSLAEFLPYCVEKKISVIAGGPYNSGILAADNLTAAATYNYRESPPAIIEKAQKIKAVCDRHSVPMRAAALQFILAHPAIASVIPGARSATELEENFALVKHPIPAAFWAELKAEQLIVANAPTPG